jgi:hypothetical protein
MSESNLLLSDVRKALESRGIAATDRRIDYAVRSGKLPQPRMDSAHRRLFTAADVDQLALLFAGTKRPVEAT